jgi:transcriptional regulator with XRE-family HTH domain
MAKQKGREDPQPAIYLGRAVACYRHERGLKVKELAESSGVSASHLYSVESGGKYPSVRVVDLLAAALSVTSSELMARAERIAAEEKAGWPAGWAERTAGK